MWNEYTSTTGNVFCKKVTDVTKAQTQTATYSRCGLYNFSLCQGICGYESHKIFKPALN